MKLRTILLTGILLGTTTLAIATEPVDITNLIEEAKNSAPEQRFELINQIKGQIATMNESDRATAIAQVQSSRDTMRNTRANQFSGELTDDKIAEIKATMSPEQIKIFEERIQNGNKEARRGPPTAEQIAEIKSNMTPEQVKIFEERIQARQEAGTRGRPEGMGRPDNIPEGATRPEGIGRPDGVGRHDGVRPNNIPEGMTRPNGVGGRP